MAKKDLVRLLARLYGDPVHEARFQQDRAKFLKRTKLSAKERDLVIAGDAEAIRAYLGKESAKTHIVDSALTHIVDTALTHIVDSALMGAKKPKKPKK